MNFRLLGALFALIITISSTFGKAVEVRTVYESLEHSFAESDIHFQLRLVNEVVTGAYSIPRHQVPVQELRNLKYALCHWREEIARRTAIQLEQETEEEDRAVALLIFAKLKARLTPEIVDILIRTAERHSNLKHEIAKLLADSGPRELVEPVLKQWSDEKALLRLGPPIINKIVPYAGTNLKGLDWVDGSARKMDPMTVENLDAYEFTSRHSLRYRGHELKTGDIFVFDLALSHDGLMSSFASSPSVFNHAGVFVVFERQGRRVPALLEMHEKGNRVIPLSNFLERHVYYAESYRLKTANEGWRDRVVSEIEKIQLGERLLHDFRALPNLENDDPQRDGDQGCTTCTAMTEMIFRKAGVDIRFERTSFLEGAKRNLETLGLGGYDSLVLPVSLARHSLMEMVGMFDNGRFRENMGREAIIGDVNSPGSAGSEMNRAVVDFNRLPKNRYTDAIPALSVNRRSFAPPEAIAFFLTTNEIIGPQSEKVADACGEYIQRLGGKPLKFDNLQKDPQMNRAIDEGFKGTGIPTWYKID